MENNMFAWLVWKPHRCKESHLGQQYYRVCHKKHLYKVSDQIWSNGCRENINVGRKTMGKGWQTLTISSYGQRPDGLKPDKCLKKTYRFAFM